MSPVERLSQTMRAMGFDPITESYSVRWFVWLFKFIFALVVDGWEGLSMTRFLAVYFASLVGFSVRELKGVISGNALTLAIVAAAIAFGKSTFTFLLRRWAGRHESTDTTTNVTIKTDAPLRDVDRGFQPTP